MSPLLPHAEKQLSDPTQRIHKVLETARILYGLIHARYVLTAQGLTDMVRRLALCWLCTRAHARARSLAGSFLRSTCHSAPSRLSHATPLSLCLNLTHRLLSLYPHSTRAPRFRSATA